MPHTCHALRCRTEIPECRLLCLKHWRMVPKALQRAVWQHYRPGQERTKDPSQAYVEAAVAAVQAVAAAERQWRKIV